MPYEPWEPESLDGPPPHVHSMVEEELGYTYVIVKRCTDRECNQIDVQLRSGAA